MGGAGPSGPDFFFSLFCPFQWGQQAAAKRVPFTLSPSTQAPSSQPWPTESGLGFPYPHF